MRRVGMMERLWLLVDFTYPFKFLLLTDFRGRCSGAILLSEPVKILFFADRQYVFYQTFISCPTYQSCHNPSHVNTKINNFSRAHRIGYSSRTTINFPSFPSFVFIHMHTQISKIPSCKKSIVER